MEYNYISWSIIIYNSHYWSHRIVNACTEIYRATLLLNIINSRRACAARVTVVVLSVCLSVRLSVRASSSTTGYEAGNEWHQRVVNNEEMDKNVAIFLKRLRTRDMAWKQAKKRTRAIHRARAYVGVYRFCRSMHRTWAIHCARAYVGVCRSMHICEMPCG